VVRSVVRHFLVLSLVSSAITLALPAPLLAQSGQPSTLPERLTIDRTLTVDQAVEIALLESPVVRGAVEDVVASVARVRAAEAETRPWLSANAFASGGSENSIVAGPAAAQPQMIMGLARGAFADGNLMLMYPLATGGRLSAMVRKAAAARGAAQADLETQRQDVALMTRAAYREALARHALVAVADARAQEGVERLRIDRDKYRQGSVPLVTVRRDEAESAQAEQASANARRDEENVLTQLKTVMGVNLASHLALIEPTDNEPAAELVARLVLQAPAPDRGSVEGAADVAALLRLAEARRPELHAASRRNDAARAESSAARGAFGPQVNLFAMGDAMQQRGSSGFAGATFGAAASLPLYNGGQRHALLDAAEAERRKQEQDRERLALQIGQEVAVALTNLRAAEQSVATATAARTAADEGYRVEQQRYEAGRSVLVELLDALSARTQAQSGVVQAHYEYGVARDQLLRAVGVQTP
jgi:outer membrane protein TolC